MSIVITYALTRYAEKLTEMGINLGKSQELRKFIDEAIEFYLNQQEAQTQTNEEDEIQKRLDASGE